MSPDPLIWPEDDYNLALLSNVRPREWQNPEPAPWYHLVVLGAGTAGLVTAAGAAALGARVALVERHLLGGDCLNFGCVPSKSLISSSRAAARARRAGEFGLAAAGPEVDFPAVMARLRRLRAQISRHDAARRFEQMGVHVFLGEGRFVGPRAVAVGDALLPFKRAVIATGSRPTIPPVPGLAEVGALTNETVFSLTARPGRLAVIGAGPIGCELAQAFQRLGSQVFLLHRNDRILNREDRDASRILGETFAREGMTLILECRLKRLERRGAEKIIHYEKAGREESLAVDEVLVGIGRAPNVEGLGLEAAGVNYDPEAGVVVNDFLQTTNARIYAAGDICLKYKFTHAADAAARVVLQNALFWGRQRLSALTIPYCIYTEPELAHVGLPEKEAQERGSAVQTLIRLLQEVDRAVVDGETEGFVKVRLKAGTDQILGATIVAPHAGEMINEITLAMTARLGLATLSRVIHPYPTQSEAIKQTADAYYRSRLTPFLKKLISWRLGWMK